MKVRYIGDYYQLILQKGKVYDVLGKKYGFYKLMTEIPDEVGTAYFPPTVFEIVEDDKPKKKAALSKTKKQNNNLKS